MCVTDDSDRADVWDESFPKARKEHRCEACGSPIRRGEKYTRLSVVSDGTARSHKSCAACWIDISEFGKMPDHLKWPPDHYPHELNDCIADYDAGKVPPALQQLRDRLTQRIESNRKAGA